MKLEELSEDELSVVMDFLPGKTLHRLMVVSVFSSSTYYYYHTFKRLALQRTTAIQKILDAKQKNFPHKTLLKKFMDMNEEINKKNKKPEETEFWKSSLIKSNEKMIEFKFKMHQHKYNMNKEMNFQTWEKYIENLKRFEVYDIEKCFPISREKKVKMSLGLAYCLDVQKRPVWHAKKKHYTTVFEHLKFFSAKTNFTIWNDTHSQPFELFTIACHYSENFEQINEEMKKVHSEGKKFQFYPLKIMLEYSDISLAFVKMFFNGEYQCEYETKEEEYLSMALKESSFDVICYMIDNSNFKMTPDLFYAVFNKSTRFDGERMEIRGNLEKKYGISEVIEKKSE